MYLLFLFALLITSCTSTVYENTTYGIDAFVLDSEQIIQGKEAVLQIEKAEIGDCLSDAFTPYEDILIEGDILTVVFYYPKRPDLVEALLLLNQRAGFSVCEGKICLPYVSSPVEVEDLTLTQVREKIRVIYGEIFPEAQVFVNFRKRRERWVQVIGAIRSTTIAVDGRMRLAEVLAKAGVHPHTNLFKSIVVRNDKQLPLDLYKLLHEGNESQNIVMRGGDQIFLAAAGDATVMVTGEVLKPQAIPVPYGFISLREALVIARENPFTADKNCLTIIRGGFTRPKVYLLSWNEILHLPNQSLLLIPGDVVCVTDKPISQWNRFINQLLPGPAGLHVINVQLQIQREASSD